MAFNYTRFSTLKQEQGDSGRRQIESARKYAAERGYILDESIEVDRGKSAGQVGISAKGLWMDSLKRIESKTIPRGSILIVESPDRVSRQRFSEAYPTYQRILSAGIEIHFLSIRDVLKPEHSFTNILRVGVEIDRANCESVLKSERVGEAWSKKRETCKRQNGHERPPSSLVEAAKGQHIQVIPERPAIVKKIFEGRRIGSIFDPATNSLRQYSGMGTGLQRQASAVVALLCQCHSQFPKCCRGIPAPHKEIDRLSKGFGGQSHPIPATNRLKKSENKCPFFRGTAETIFDARA